MAIESAYVVAGNDILISDLNLLRKDLLTNDIAIAGVKTFADNMYLAATKKFYLDGGGDTYITEGVANNIGCVVGGVTAMEITASLVAFPQDIRMQPTKKLYLDGGGDTYISEASANSLQVFTTGTQRLVIDSNGASVTNGSLIIYNQPPFASSHWAIKNEGIGSLSFSWMSTSLQYYFNSAGTAYADVAWSTFSPDIKKHDKYKSKDILTSKDFLEWALEDANKPVKPYKGIPKVKEKNEKVKSDNCIFNNEQEAKEECDKYAKDISKIAIGIAKWAEQAELRLQALEASK